MPATATSPSSVKAVTDEPGYPAGLHGRANRVLFVMPGWTARPGNPARLSRDPCSANFPSKIPCMQCFFVARPGKSARVCRGNRAARPSIPRCFPFKFTYFMTHDVSLPLNSTHYAMLYPQNGDRIVTIDSVTSLHPM